MNARYVRTCVLTACAFAFATHANADRVYIMNTTGYNSADAPLIAAIQSLGHTVDVSAIGAFTLPADFVSTCIDPENGYDWLCFFGDMDRTTLATQVQEFIGDGGKVLLQYEVDCCTTSSISAANIVSAVTGLTVTPNSEPNIAFSGLSELPGWEAESLLDCIDVTGNAYKCMDGLPTANALMATANLAGATPNISVCGNFGFRFLPGDLPGNNGGLIGFGDINLYYNSAGEPPNNSGTQPVNMDVVELIFATQGSTCAFLPSGCLQNSVPQKEIDLIGAIYPVPADDALVVEFPRGAAKEFWIFNTQGQCVMHERSAGADRMNIEVSDLAPGLYHIRAAGGNRNQERSFMVVRGGQ